MRLGGTAGKAAGVAEDAGIEGAPTPVADAAE